MSGMQLERRLKKDPSVLEFMKRVGMYAPGVYLVPEVREVTPGHLVRSGHSSAFDVTFGHRAGAVAVFLLLEGKTGYTVVNVVGDKIYYMPTSEAIKRKEVDLDEVALFESLGTCFGRHSPEVSLHLNRNQRTEEPPHLRSGFEESGFKRLDNNKRRYRMLDESKKRSW